jgi:hypothetical protein
VVLLCGEADVVSLFFAFLLLNGSVLVVYQMTIVLLVTCCFYPHLWKWVLKTLVLTLLLSPFVWPILLYSPYTHQGRQVFWGWSSPQQLADAFMKPLDMSIDASWEKSLYVGPFVLVFGGLLRYRHVFTRIDLVLAIVGLLCCGPILGFLFNWTHLPAVDRLPMRLSIYPFTWFLYRSLT